MSVSNQIFEFLIILCCFTFAFEAVVIEIFPKAVKCYDINPEYINHKTCYVKPIARNAPHQLILHLEMVKELTEVTIDFKLLYKYTNVYRTFIVDVKDIDVCQVMRREGPIFGHKALIIIYKTFAKFSPSLMKGCPLYGDYYLTGDLNKTLSPLLPPVFPTGDWRVQLEAFTKDKIYLGGGYLDLQFKVAQQYRMLDLSMRQFG